MAIQYFLAVCFAFVSAACNALSAVWQRRATGQVNPADLFRGRLIKQVIRKRLWLAGIGLNVAGFLAQAVALHNGALVLVQPLLTTDIVFLLLFLHFGKTSVRVNKRAFIGAILIMAGLGALLAVAHPQGGHVIPDFWRWLVTFIVIASLIMAGSVVMRRWSNIPLRATIAGIVAGLHFAFTAAFTKLVMGELQQYGFMHTLLSWQLLGLIIVGISSGLTMQSMYGAGPLAITQPGLEITEALIGITLGIVLFGDSVDNNVWALAVESFSGLVAAIGIILLTGSSSLQRRSDQLKET